MRPPAAAPGRAAEGGGSDSASSARRALAVRCGARARTRARRTAGCPRGRRRAAASSRTHWVGRRIALERDGGRRTDDGEQSGGGDRGEDGDGGGAAAERVTGHDRCLLDVGAGLVPATEPAHPAAVAIQAPERLRSGCRRAPPERLCRTPRSGLSSRHAHRGPRTAGGHERTTPPRSTCRGARRAPAPRASWRRRLRASVAEQPAGRVAGRLPHGVETLREHVRRLRAPSSPGCRSARAGSTSCAAGPGTPWPSPRGDVDALAVHRPRRPRVRAAGGRGRRTTRCGCSRTALALWRRRTVRRLAGRAVRRRRAAPARRDPGRCRGRSRARPGSCSPRPAATPWEATPGRRATVRRWRPGDPGGRRPRADSAGPGARHRSPPTRRPTARPGRRTRPDGRREPDRRGGSRCCSPASSAAVVVAIVAARLSARSDARRRAGGHRRRREPPGRAVAPRSPSSTSRCCWRRRPSGWPTRPTTRRRPDRRRSTGTPASSGSSRSAACRRTPSSPGGRTLTFGIGVSVVGWPVGPTTRAARADRPSPASGARVTVAAPSPVDERRAGCRGSTRGAGPGSGRSRTLDGTSRLLLEGDEVGGRPVDGAVTADGRRLLLVVAEPAERGATTPRAGT